MKNNKLFCAIASAIMAMSLFSCKEDEYVPSTVPTVPTSFSLEDGAVIESTEVQLSASGSTVEDENLAISYDYYIGTSVDNMQKTDVDVKLKPYTQYFWYAQAKTEVSEGEMMDVRTFYCVPPFKIQTENGEGEWKAEWKWEYMDGDRDATLKLTADREGYKFTQPTFTSDMTSFEITLADYDAYTHWWDDEHGVYCEPIVYNLEVSFTRKIGDKDVVVRGQAQELILDKNVCVRDHEYNVYRVVTIGDQTWLADDLRVKSYVDENGNVIQLSEKKDDGSEKQADYFIATISSTGATGFLYNFINYVEGEETGKENLKLINNSIKGYHIATIDELKKMLSFYIGHDVKEDVDYDVVSKIGSKYDWKGIIDFDTSGAFNAKPFGAYQFDTYYPTCMDIVTIDGYGIFKNWNSNELSIGTSNKWCYAYVLVRCIKD